MKKSIFIIIVSLFVVFAFSCGNKSTNQTTETHAHEDGTVHSEADHAVTEENKAEQESFVVDGDTTETHSHDDHGHDHDHDHQH